MKAKTFCLAPWTHGLVHTDLSMRPCCNILTPSGTLSNRVEWWNSQYMKDLRSSLYHGVRHPDCARCWLDEDAKKESLRLHYNNLFRKYVSFKSIVESATTNFALDYQPVTWDLRLGNLCNLKCVMCNSHLSDKIQQEEIEFHQTIVELFPVRLSNTNTSNLNWTHLPEAQEFFNDIISSVKWLKLQGGEPLAIKHVRELIDSLIPHQTTLAVTTNGTVLDDKLANSLKNMERVEFSISVEAIGPVNNIIRYGSNWDTIEKNIFELTKFSNVEVQLNHVLQITSVFYLKDVIEFCELHNLHLELIDLLEPDYLGLNACPPEYLYNLVNDINSIDIKHPKNQYIKEYVKNKVDSARFNQNHWNDFKQYVKLLDTIRPNKYSSILKFKELL